MGFQQLLLYLSFYQNLRIKHLSTYLISSSYLKFNLQVKLTFHQFLNIFSDLVLTNRTSYQCLSFQLTLLGGPVVSELLKAFIIANLELRMYS